jgi:transcriptional regulator with PAS, ATPase and Fis domain
LFGNSAVIQPEDLPECVLNSKTTENSEANSYQAQVTAVKRSLVMTALSDAKGNHAEAARSLDVSSSYFRRLARDLNITLS